MNRSNKRKKWIGGGILAGISIILAFYIAVIVHLVATGQMDVLDFQFPSLKQGLELIKQETSVQQLFAIVAGALLVLILVFIVAQRPAHRTDLRQIVPGVSTPLPAGQNQHGSARWLSRGEIEDEFANCVIDKRNDTVRHYAMLASRDKKAVKNWRMKR